MTNQIIVVEGFTDLLTKFDALSNQVAYLKLGVWFLAGIVFAITICICVRR